jgi:hypothetical protein
MQYYCHKSERSSLPGWVFVSGIIRTLACGGWVYITSTDDHDAHDIFMISYIVFNVPWMLGGVACTPCNRISIRRRRWANCCENGSQLYNVLMSLENVLPWRELICCQMWFLLNVSSFFATLIPLGYFFVQHKIHRIPGGSYSPSIHTFLPYSLSLAYTHYAFFEWALIFLDILFDSVTELEFKEAQLKVEILSVFQNS